MPLHGRDTAIVSDKGGPHDQAPCVTWHPDGSSAAVRPLVHHDALCLTFVVWVTLRPDDLWPSRSKYTKVPGSTAQKRAAPSGWLVNCKHDHAVHADLHLNLRLVEVDRALCEGCRKACHCASLCSINRRLHTQLVSTRECITGLPRWQDHGTSEENTHLAGGPESAAQAPCRSLR